MGMYDQMMPGMQMTQPGASAFMSPPMMNPQALMLLQMMQNRASQPQNPMTASTMAQAPNPAGMPGQPPGGMPGQMGAPGAINPQMIARIRAMLSGQGQLPQPPMGGPSGALGAPYFGLGLGS